MNPYRLFLEILPVVLAIVAIPLLIKSATLGREKLIVGPAIVACVLLIVAQTGWIESMRHGNMVMQGFFDLIWSVFNTIVMGTFIIGAIRTRRRR